MRLKPFDYLIVFLAFAVTLLLLFQGWRINNDNLQVRIQDSRGELVYPIDMDQHIDVDGPLGQTHVVIQAGEVFISESPCPNKTCIASGSIDKSGQWLACLPNQVFVRLEGQQEGAVDAQSF